MNSIAKKVTEITVNAVGDRETIVTSFPCWGLEVRQKASESPKLLFLTADVVTGGTAEEHAAGTAAFYYADRGGKEYGSGQILGYIETSTSSGTFQLIHYTSPRVS